MINSEAQERDPDSILHYVRKAIRLRKSVPALIYGDYNPIGADDPYIYAYTRRLGDTTVWVLLNFTKEDRLFSRPLPGLGGMEVLLNNYPDIRCENGYIRLYKWQALVLMEFVASASSLQQ